MRKTKLIDASIGIPALSLTSIANHAFQNCQSDRSISRQKESILTFCSYFKKRGFFDKAHKNSLDINEVLVTSGGTTEGYSLIVRLLSEDIKFENLNHNRNLKPVIIMPTPTYGVFFNQPLALGIEVVKVTRDIKNGGVLSIKDLEQTIKALHSEGKRVIAYYDANPHNPLGTVRKKKETLEIAKILHKYTKVYKKQDHAFNKINSLDEWNGPASRIRTIDDMVSDGLEYNSTKPFSFSQLKNSFDDAFALFGTSKVGSFEFKSALVISNSRDIKNLKKIQEAKFSPPVMESFYMLEAYFNNKEPFANQRKTFLKELSRTHSFAGKFMKVLINGISDVPDISNKELERMIGLYANSKNIPTQEAKNILQQGISGVQVITSPEAGFFHLLSFGGLRDTIHNGNETSLFDETNKNLGIEFRKGSKIGLNQGDRIVRATFALPLEDIIELTDRIKCMTKTISKSRPDSPSVK